MLSAEYAAIAKENRTSYTDCKNNICHLTGIERAWFRETVAAVLAIVRIKIPVYMCDHEPLPGIHSDALGLHWKNAMGDEFITIDNWFIHNAFEVKFNGAYDIDDETLESVLYHELAHIKYSRHTKWHEQLTEYYISLVEGDNYDHP